MAYDVNIKQETPTSCAIKCQQIILWDYGVDVTEKELRELARFYGWYDDKEGVYMHDNGKLLRGFGITYHHSQNNTIDQIKMELGQQHRVMVNINHSKLLDTNDKDIRQEACHAVIVTRVFEKHIMITNPADGRVDEKISSRNFLNAWKDSCCYMLATDTPAIYEYHSWTKRMKAIK